MGSRRRNLLIVLLVLGLVLASGLVIATKRTLLGLDLRGRTQLVHDARATPPPPKKGVPQDPAASPDPNPGVYTFPNAWAAVNFAANRKPECVNNQCTSSGPSYYLFEKKTHVVKAGPAERKRDLYLQFKNPNKQPPGTVIRTVPQGTLVAAAPTSPSLTLPTSELSSSPQFVLKDRPALNGTEITKPEQSFDQISNQPNVTFNFTGNGQSAFQDVTRTISQRGSATAPPGTVSSGAADNYSQH